MRVINNDQRGFEHVALKDDSLHSLYLTPRPITVRGRSLYIVVRSNVYSSSRIIELYIAKETNQSCAKLQGATFPQIHHNPPPKGI